MKKKKVFCIAKIFIKKINKMKNKKNLNIETKQEKELDINSFNEIMSLFLMIISISLHIIFIFLCMDESTNFFYNVCVWVMALLFMYYSIRIKTMKMVFDFKRNDD